MYFDYLNYPHVFRNKVFYRKNNMQTKISHIPLVLLSAVVFVKATTSAAEARSPRGWVNHHLGGIEKEITHAEKSLVSG